MDHLVADFEHIITLCEELEATAPTSARLKQRIAHAYARAVEKAVVLGWYAKTEPELIADDVPFRTTLLRHAERGARDFVA